MGGGNSRLKKSRFNSGTLYSFIKIAPCMPLICRTSKC